MCRRSGTDAILPSVRCMLAFSFWSNVGMAADTEGEGDTKGEEGSSGGRGGGKERLKSKYRWGKMSRRGAVSGQHGMRGRVTKRAGTDRPALEDRGASAAVAVTASYSPNRVERSCAGDEEDGEVERRKTVR